MSSGGELCSISFNKSRPRAIFYRGERENILKRLPRASPQSQTVSRILDLDQFILKELPF